MLLYPVSDIKCGKGYAPLMAIAAGSCMLVSCLLVKPPKHAKNSCLLFSFTFPICKLLGGWPSLQWRYNERDGVSNHQQHDRLLSCLFRRRSKRTSKLRVTGLCEGHSQVTGEFRAQKASNAENATIWWRHHTLDKSLQRKNNEW